MCRIAAYLGDFPVTLSTVLEKPDNSLIQQSISCREDSSIKVNADGFGLGWYNHAISNQPATFKSTQPAWNDLNLRDLGSVVESTCFLAHIRASIIGHVSHDNCHPFRIGHFLCAHNGEIDGFERIRFHLQKLLPRELLDGIFGHTDSEYLFALIMYYYDRLSTKKSTLHRLTASYRLALSQLQCFLESEGISVPQSTINLVITDGRDLFATRYGSVDHPARIHKSLYFLQGDSLDFSDHNFMVHRRNKRAKFTMLASEKIVPNDSSWQKVPVNHFFLLKHNQTFELQSI